MATARIAANRTKHVTVGSDKVVEGDSGGKIKHVFDSYTLPAAILAVNDTIDIFEIPVGARIVEATISCISLGTTGIMDLGWTASTNGTTVADANGFISASDAGGQAVTTQMTAQLAMPGFLKKFDNAGCVIQLIATEASTETAVVINFSISYVID